MTWFYLALAASVLWGFGYTLSDEVFKNGISPSFYMLVSGGVYLLGAMALNMNDIAIKENLRTLSESPKVLGYLILTSLCYVAGAFCIYSSIADKNASLASIIEISYPFFTILFAYVLFGSVGVSWPVILGAMFVFVGVSIIQMAGFMGGMTNPKEPSRTSLTFLREF